MLFFSLVIATTILAIAYILWSSFIGVIPSAQKNLREIEISKWNYRTDVNIKICWRGKFRSIREQIRKKKFRERMTSEPRWSNGSNPPPPWNLITVLLISGMPDRKTCERFPSWNNPELPRLGASTCTHARARGVGKKRAKRRKRKNKRGDRQFAHRGRVADLIHRRKDLRGEHALVAGWFVGGRTTSVPQTQRDKANPRGWQATSDHRTDIHEQQPWALLLPSLSLFVTVDQPVVQQQSIYRPSTETRRYVEHTWE